MPKYVADGSSSIFHVDFKVNGQLVVPSAASYALTMNGGAQIGSPAEQDITLSPYSTSVDISISEEENTMTLPNEVRYVDVKFTYNGLEYSQSGFYILKVVTHFPLDANEVRTVLGVSDTELPDESIDILDALFLTQQDIPDTNIQTVMDNGTALVPFLIQAVKYKAAIIASEAIENFTMQSEQSDKDVYKRFAKVDFKSLRESLAVKYSAAINGVAGLTDPTTPLLSLMATGTDNITGQ